MKIRKFFNIVVSLMIITSTLLGPRSAAVAMPMGPTDETKVPHYFGPYPNWANSPFTLPDVTVTITGDGSGATAAATVGGNGAVTGVSITNPGIGYSNATADITGAGTGATATVTVTPSGIVTGVNVDAQGGGYTMPVVNFNGGNGTGTLVQVGNSLTERAYATGFAAAPGTLGPVFTLVPVTMPANGQVQGIQYFNQATGGLSPNPSAGNLFYAYLLRPTGAADEYTVLWSSGEQTVPALADPAVGVVETIAVPNVPVTTGDVLGFYGEGIPFDDLSTGNSTVYYTAPVLPTEGSTVALGGPDFPVFAQQLTFSISASVIDLSTATTLTNATATAYGGVDAVNVVDFGSGYTMPTVDFDMPDAPDGVQAQAHVASVALGDAVDGLDPATGAITAIVVDNPGSGYSAAPNVVIRDGTIYDPIAGGSGATATATLKILSVAVDTYGQGYVSAPSVSISDPSGNGALISATVSAGGVTGISLGAGGSGYITQGGIKKFQDGLPVLCDPKVGWASCTDNNLGQHIPIGVPDTTTFTTANGFAADADYYVIALVQHREQMSSSLPAKTLLREYVQLETSTNQSFSKSIPLTNDLLDGTSVPALMPDGTQAVAVDDPHFLGPLIIAQKDRAVRIVFYNLLPTGAEGDLFLPVDSSMMGSGMGPMDMMSPMNEGTVTDMVRNPVCTESPKSMDCFKDNRATLHLHGGITPWISDGTPHQWITPANEDTPWPEGVSVAQVPDMVTANSLNLGVPDCSANNDGCMSFYYTNQQSARLMFYHDHAWGITRLNVYAGEAAGYIIRDATEQKLIDSKLIPADEIPLIVQDRTFVPGADQLAAQDPTWDSTRWGGAGNLWYHHVYMPAQNPGDPGGMSAYGRWMYGPWFWPPAKDAVYGPIDNPYFDPNCNIDDPATWQYQTDPFCEPAKIPGTPNISVGMEQFNDTPLVNGTAYPTTTLQPKSYRFRVLNAANDRFWNLQWYVADPRTGTQSEVALNPAELAAAQTDPVVFPTPDTTWSPAGPSWIQIGSEGGFLPAPVVVPNQPITWITDPTRFDVGNVDKHSLLLAPAERADVIVDFSKYAGKTLILYNDAPAAFPARVPSYDYYTGAPDMSPNGPAAVLPGYGPNTRTVMQVKIASATPAPAFNLSALNAAFRHHADGSGVFESGQHPIIVGQAAYNSAYGTSFATSSWCNAPGTTLTRCDGFARISEQGGDMFGFNTLKSPTTKFQVKLEPKAIHDEMNASSFDEFGRMTANLGLEAVPATPGLQNVILYPYVNPSTELIDATNLPTADIKVTPISAADGTQIWKFTHNGVDTHPIHFHLFDVQVINRVTWDNIVIPPDTTELGWKDTVRMSPLEDTIVALRPIIPKLPFEVPNSVRELNPMMPDGSTAMFNNVDAQGNPTAQIVNKLVNFGWEYVYHCHILSHEEMDMMRPVLLAVPPLKPDGLAYALSGTASNPVLTLTWNDNSITETEFVVQKKVGTGNWADLTSIPMPLGASNDHGQRSYVDSAFTPSATQVSSYRIVAKNTVGYGGEYMSMTVQSMSGEISIPLATLPAAPTNFTATAMTGPTRISLAWTDNASDEANYILTRTPTTGGWVDQTLPANTTSFVDSSVTAGTYTYTLVARNAVGDSTPPATASATITAVVTAPVAPTTLRATPFTTSVILRWTDRSTNESGFEIQYSRNGITWTSAGTVGPNVTTFTHSGLLRRTIYLYRVRAFTTGTPTLYSGWSNIIITRTQ